MGFNCRPDENLWPDNWIHQNIRGPNKSDKRTKQSEREYGVLPNSQTSSTRASTPSMAAKPQRKSSDTSKRKRIPNHKAEGPSSDLKRPRVSSNPDKFKSNSSNFQSKFTKKPFKSNTKEYQKPSAKKDDVEDSKKLQRLRAKVRPFRFSFLPFGVLYFPFAYTAACVCVELLVAGSCLMTGSRLYGIQECMHLIISGINLSSSNV